MKLRAKSLAKCLNQPFSFDVLYDVEMDDGDYMVKDNKGHVWFVEKDLSVRKLYEDSDSILLVQFEEVDEDDQTQTLKIV